MKGIINMNKYYSLVDLDNQEEITYQINIDINDRNVVVIDIALEHEKIDICHFSQDLQFALHIVNGVLRKDASNPALYNFTSYSIAIDKEKKKIVTTITSKNYRPELLFAEISSAFHAVHMSFFM